jgi:murein L,D-transpeptidase YcbB/YkuD
VRNLCRVVTVLAICGLVAGCRARPRPVGPPVVDAARQTIAAAVASLERRESVVIDGEPLYATVVLPEIYRRRDLRLAWTDAAAIHQVIDAIHASAAEGLDPADYHEAALVRARAAGAATREAGARLDLLLTDAAAVLAHHLRFGKLGPVALDGVSPGHAAVAELSTVLQRALDDGRVAAAFEDLKPRHPFYTRLKDALAQ